jgi:hypothetical protein
VSRNPDAFSDLNWKLILAAVAAVGAAALIAPWMHQLNQTPIPVVIAAGAIGYCARLRVLDAALFAAAHLLAEFGSEPVAGPQALCCLTLGTLVIWGRPRFALFVGGALFSMLLLGIEFKLRFAGSNLTVQDVRYFLLQFRDNVGVMASQPTLIVYLSAATRRHWERRQYGYGSKRCRASERLARGSIIGATQSRGLPCSWPFGVQAN